LQGEAGGDAVYPDGLFADGGDAVAVQDCEDVGAGFGFLVDCDAVFEVVGYAVDGEGAGFFEEAHGGAGDCRGVSWVCMVELCYFVVVFLGCIL
jgi:hypothetical protein